MTRDEAIKLLKEQVKNDNLIKHCLAVGAIMKGLAKELGENPERWEIIGILHDLDYEYTKDKPEIHAKKTVELLGDKLTEEEKNAILAHNNHAPLNTKMDYALYAADPMSGLVTAAVLVRPEKKIEGLKVKSLKKKFKDKSFAAGANRENIRKIEEINIELSRFFEISIESMKEIAEELGL
ncbi:HD domain-containing protein [Marinitoga aeolica]|uniref:HD domain-containing protein n=1 Tax=Marinitoga aeolica TaxID=2809031 RepID=A0ABY8PTN7_9BACT|nr:HD domain-containing protein [Marinitoga aeolica]WGS65991.1 HD domain-containing protein [Marinitoga aeolica]